jgi:hypothetical protein
MSRLRRGGDVLEQLAGALDAALGRRIGGRSRAPLLLLGVGAGLDADVRVVVVDAVDERLGLAGAARVPADDVEAWRRSSL